MLEIKSYKDASLIPEEYLPSLVDSEIECWWSRPFDEYKKCDDCGAIFSIEDVYGSLEEFRKGRDDWTDFNCLVCSCSTNFIYEKKAFLELLQDYIKKDVSAVLLVTAEQKVEGFWVLLKTTVWWLVENEFATRPGSYDKDLLKDKLSNELFWISDAYHKEIICLHQIYISPYFRHWDISFNIMKELFYLNKEYLDFPVIWEAKYDNRFYPISRSMWFSNLLDDKYWYIVQIIQKYWLVLDFLQEINWYSDKKLISNLFKYKKESLRILKQKKKTLNTKFYN